MIIDPGDANPAADTLNGVYEKYHTMKPGERVLDLGAHRGYFTVKAAELVGPHGSVVAFEPHPGNFKRLLSRVRECGAELNVLCVNAGAWDSDGMQMLWPAINNSGGHSFERVEIGQEPEPIACHVVDIGAWLRRNQFEPDFAKIDTELSEFRIISSLMRVGILPEFACEIHNQQMWDSCQAVLKAYGYKVTPDSFTNYYLYAKR